MTTTVGIFVTGDSLSYAATAPVGKAWPYQLDGHPSQINVATGGRQIAAHLEPAYAAQVAALAAKYTEAIIQGGVNDFAAAVSLATVQTALTSMVTIAKAAGLTVYVCGIAPWKNDPAWDATAQTKTDDYNAWLASEAAGQGFTYVDVYTPLEDDITPDALEADYDGGDGIHPNTVGFAVYATQVDAVLPAFTRIAPMTHVLKIWRGAVEPAKTSPSGNQLEAWRGAVEPAEASASYPSTGGGLPTFSMELTHRNFGVNRTRGGLR